MTRCMSIVCLWWTLCIVQKKRRKSVKIDQIGIYIVQAHNKTIFVSLQWVFYIVIINFINLSSTSRLRSSCCPVVCVYFALQKCPQSATQFSVKSAHTVCVSASSHTYKWINHIYSSALYSKRKKKIVIKLYLHVAAKGKSNAHLIIQISLLHQTYWTSRVCIVDFYYKRLPWHHTPHSSFSRCILYSLFDVAALYSHCIIISSVP